VLSTGQRANADAGSCDYQINSIQTLPDDPDLMKTAEEQHS